MVKRWVDAGEIAKTEDIDKEHWEYEELMRVVPNFDKSEGAHKIYQKKEYMILQTKKGYIVYNSKKDFYCGHSHIYGFKMAKTIIDNCIKKRKPRTDSIYILDSHIRVSDDKKYITTIEELIEAKKNRGKEKYNNKPKR